MTGRLARIGVPLGILGFWTSAALGAAAQPGYTAREDYLSALAAHGANDPAWGLGMFGFAALAVGSTAAVVPLVVPAGVAARTSARLIAASAACLVVGGIARVECPGGAAGCNAGPLVVEQVTLSSRVHAGAVGLHQILLAAGLLTLSVGAWRAGRRALAVLTGAGAVLGPVLAVVTFGLDPGTSQRLWVATGHALLLALAAWPSWTGTGRGS